MPTIDSKYLNIFKFMFALLPVGLITGPFIPDFIIVISVIFFLTNIKKFKEFNKILLSNKIIFYLFLFNIYLFINLAITQSYNYNYTTTLFYFRFFVFVIFFYYLLKYTDLKKIFFYILSCSILFVLTDTFIQYFSGEDLFGYKALCVRDCDNSNFQMLRLTGPFDGKAIVGSYLVRLMPLFVGLYFLNFIKKINFYFISLMILLITTIVFLSGERSSFFFLILSVNLMILLLDLKKNLRIKLFLIFISYIVLISVIFSEARFRMYNFTLMQMGFENKFLKKEDPKKFNFILKTLKDEEAKDNKTKDNKTKDNKLLFFSYHHNSHYIVAINMFKDNFLFGGGVKSFRYLCHKYSTDLKFGCTTHPHNIPLQFLSEIGLFGFLFYMIIIFFLLKVFFIQFLKLFLLKNSNKTIKNSMICFYICVFINIFPFAPSGNFFNNWLSIFFYLPLPFILDDFKK